MNENLTRIVILLDRSGSMTSVQEATVAGFNEFIRQQQQVEGETEVLLVQFDDQYEIVFDLPLVEVPLLDRDSFIPRGSTALYDAQGRTITMLGRQLASLADDRRARKIIVVTLTDGQENASRVYELKQVAEMVKNHHENLGWEFIFLGANQDAVAVGASMNIPLRSSMTYTATAAAMASVMRSTSTQVALFRQGAAPEFTQEDREQALTEKKAASA
jgi:uncharacterized protein YegL